MYYSLSHQYRSMRKESTTDFQICMYDCVVHRTVNYPFAPSLVLKNSEGGCVFMHDNNVAALRVLCLWLIFCVPMMCV